MEKKQEEYCQMILDELCDCGHDHDISSFDLLDVLASTGLILSPPSTGNPASQEYMSTLVKMEKEKALSRLSGTMNRLWRKR